MDIVWVQSEDIHHVSFRILTDLRSSDLVYRQLEREREMGDNRSLILGNILKNKDPISPRRNGPSLQKEPWHKLYGYIRDLKFGEIRATEPTIIPLTLLAYKIIFNVKKQKNKKNSYPYICIPVIRTQPHKSSVLRSGHPYAKLITPTSLTFSHHPRFNHCNWLQWRPIACISFRKNYLNFLWHRSKRTI